MFALIAKMRIDSAKMAAFEEAFGAFGAKVLAKEPGTLTYKLGKSRTDENTYHAIEIYTDEAAFKAHVAADDFRAFRPVLATFLAEPPVADRLDIVA